MLWRISKTVFESFSLPVTPIQRLPKVDIDLIATDTAATEQQIFGFFFFFFKFPAESVCNFHQLLMLLWSCWLFFFPYHSGIGKKGVLK